MLAVRLGIEPEATARVLAEILGSVPVPVDDRPRPEPRDGRWDGPAQALRVTAMHVDPLAFVLRSAEAILAAAPMLLLGFLTTGILRAMVTPATLRRLLGGEKPSEPLRAGAWARCCRFARWACCPSCASLRRAGVPRKTLLTFAFAALILNPFSLLYGLTLLQPWILAVFVTLSMLVTIRAEGLFAGSARPEEADADAADQEPLPRPPAFGARSGLA